MSELPDVWRSARIADIAEAVFDGPHATPKLVEDGPIFLGISSLSGGRLDLSQSGRLSEQDFKTWTRRVIPSEGDLVFSYETRLGEAALIPPGLRCCLGRRLALIRPNRKVIDPRFLLYAYLGPQFQEEIRRRTVHGSTVDRIPLVEFSTFELALPGLGEQRAIAGVLGALDDKIESNRRLVATAARTLQTLSDHLDTDSLVPLMAVAIATRSTIDPQRLGGAMVDHFSLPAFDATQTPERCLAGAIQSGKFSVDAESVLVSRLNPGTSRTWHVIPDGLPALCSTEFMVLTPAACVSIAGLWLAVTAPSFTEELTRRATGTSFSHQRVRPDDAMAIEVPDVRQLPRVVDEESTGLLHLVRRTRRESASLAALRDALLPELLSGRLRVREAEKVVEGAV